MTLLSPRNLRKLPTFARFLYLQRVKGFDPPGPPLLDEQSAEWLETRLKTANLYLEFGSGGSTVLANRLGVPSITVESDRFYAGAVLKALPFPEKARILTPSMGLTGEWGMPVLGKDRKGSRYVFAPFAVLNGEFPDLVFVDGRYRVACALETARRAASAQCVASMLIDDYEYRPNYHVLEQYLGKAERIGRDALFMAGGRSVGEDVVHRFLSDPR